MRFIELKKEKQVSLNKVNAGSVVLPADIVVFQDQNQKDAKKLHAEQILSILALNVKKVFSPQV
jgi:hypothetical protein